MANETGIRKSLFVCFHCRKMFRKALRPRFDSAGAVPGGGKLRCAECGSVLISVRRGFEPPRSRDIKQWKQIEAQETRPAGHADPQTFLCRAKSLKKQQRIQKQQERLASRSRAGRSLTNVSADPQPPRWEI